MRQTLSMSYVGGSVGVSMSHVRDFVEVHMSRVTGCVGVSMSHVREFVEVPMSHGSDYVGVLKSCGSVRELWEC